VLCFRQRSLPRDLLSLLRADSIGHPVQQEAYEIAYAGTFGGRVNGGVSCGHLVYRQ
jgi:hypothetical protein